MREHGQDDTRLRPDWIAVDWGTSNLRVTAMGPGGPMAQRGSDRGMGVLGRDGFEPALLDLIGAWLPDRGTVPVLACGMVGARQGWTEASYRRVPCAPLDRGGLVAVRAGDARLEVRIVPGLSQSSPPDVMRGEETQIAGALALHPGFDGVICLPGTHSKWVRISAGEVVSFQTFLTGELFALLSTQSILRHGLTGDGWDDAAFDAALSDTLSRPERIAARLFALRADGLLNDLAPDTARARLSGYLIGMELAASKPYWLGQDVMLVGEAALSALYARALTAQGVIPRELAAQSCTLAGLVSLRSTA